MMSTGGLLSGIKRRKGGKSKSKKGGMRDDKNIKTVTINLPPQYMGGQNNDERLLKNDERPSEENLEMNDEIARKQQLIKNEVQKLE